MDVETGRHRAARRAAEAVSPISPPKGKMRPEVPLARHGGEVPRPTRRSSARPRRGGRRDAPRDPRAPPAPRGGWRRPRFRPAPGAPRASEEGRRGLPGVPRSGRRRAATPCGRASRRGGSPRRSGRPPPARRPPALRRSPGGFPRRRAERGRRTPRRLPASPPRREPRSPRPRPSSPAGGERARRIGGRPPAATERPGKAAAWRPGFQEQSRTASPARPSGRQPKSGSRR